MTAFTVERVRVSPAGNVTYDVVDATLQRFHVTVRRAYATAGRADAIIARAITHPYAPIKPLGGGPYG